MICAACEADTYAEKRVEIGSRGRRGGASVRWVCRSCQEPWQGPLPITEAPPPAPVQEPKPVPVAAPEPPAEPPAPSPIASADQLLARASERLAEVEFQLAQFDALRKERAKLRRILAAGEPARRPKRS